MACGGGCCGAAQPSAMAVEPVVQGETLSESLPEEGGTGSARSSSETQGASCKDDGCCKPDQKNVPEPDYCCSPTNIPQIATESSRKTVTGGCCSKKPSANSRDDECPPGGVQTDTQQRPPPRVTSCCSETASKPACCTTEKKLTALPPVVLDHYVQQGAGGCCERGPSASSCADKSPASVDQADPSPNTTGCCPATLSKLACCATKKKTNTAICGSETTSKSNCCTTKKKTSTTVAALEISSTDHNPIDVEKSSAGIEHIVLSISGMTCTGCETKLQRTLGTLPYLRNLRTSLVLARAEFDIDHRIASVEDVIRHLSRTTEFRCEQVSMQGSSFELVCKGRAAVVADGKWPVGVVEIRALDKDTVRVAYDASTVGARDLVERGWESAMQLAPMRLDASLDAGKRHVWHMGLMTLLSACLTIPVLVMAWAPLPRREVAYGSASLALATIVQVCVAGPFYPKALKALVYSRVIEMDLLIVLSTSAAYVFSVVSFGYMIAGSPLSTGEFFETSTLLVTLIMVGRWVASLARQKAAESISIRSLQTPTAILVEDNGQGKVIDARLLQYGDIFKVAPDSQVPTDGTVVEGSSEIDESMLTGESKPVEKHIGSPIIAGSINGQGMLTVRLTRLPGDNTITTIASMVDEAKLSRPRIQDIADKVASYFVPVVVALTIVTFVVWVAVGVAVRKQSGSQATIEAITYAITVLIVSCPCAIGLAVPMVIVIASGVAARRGVIFKSAASIEVAYKATDVVFDKTGTLTLGQLTVVEHSTVYADQVLSKSLLLGLLANIKHPVSAAVASHLVRDGVAATAVQDTKAVTGKGVQGSWQGTELRAGNAQWLGLAAHPAVQALLDKGLTVTCFTIDGAIAAIYGLHDTLRPDAAATISALQRRGLTIHILSGDDDGAVQAAARHLSIPRSNIRSRCSPADKRDYIAALETQSASKKPRKPVILFVGDGTNDAVALAQATVGIHMSSGTDIAQSAADVVLVRPELAGLLTLLAISRKAMRRVAFNFGWSFVYNTLAVLLGAGAFVSARIPPEFAGLGELVSVLPVVAAAVLLRWSKI
ncbi:E1-E2 ATPase-domain-containing protein [Boeremia exigua]|uniref:E1-E2 ATPase-domain-containing protein n=1 Tax=Boeremia exigua TaxID=749465 RepID=UPI001E8EE769|nr:E1-E2 ATPase-domain-containing protein [Boeremia exigua]KAH6629851.1 E1-E2 ATPase-domain-containing protein [Boeremia exigua]